MGGYLGSKAASGAFQAIIASMPAHDCYIEAFLGSGAVMQRKPAAARSIGIDMDAALLDSTVFPGTDLICGDAAAYLAGFDYAGSGRVLVYADPPYLLSTRTSRARYKHDFVEADHVGLLELLRGLPCSVMVSGYPSDLYDELLAGWRSIEFQVMTRGGPRTEKLWMNFAVDSVFWCSFAGENFIRRQQIKRKAKRWADKFAALGTAERQAVLAAVLGTI